MALPGNDLLTQIENDNPKLGQYLRQYLIPAVQTTASNAAVSPHGNIAAPQQIQGVSVKIAGEMMHVAISDSAPLQKGVNYFTEVSANDPSFRQPLVINHGPSRTSHPFPLPTQDDGGTNISWYVRSYHQYAGSAPSAPVVYGGTSPTPITMAGTTKLTLLPSTGSGTASGNGTQAGSGFGKSLVRLQSGAKRVVS